MKESHKNSKYLIHHWVFAFSVISLMACLQFLTGKAVAQQGQATQKLLFCESPVYDAGVVDVGQEGLVEHRFQLKNTGKSAINILKLVASCSCASAEVSTKTVGAGETLFVDVKINVTVADHAGVNTEIAVLSDKGDVLLKFQAKPKFKPYLSTEILYLNGAIFGKKALERVYVCMPYLEKLPQFIKSVASDSKIITTQILDQEGIIRKDLKGRPYFIYIASVDISIDLSSVHEAGKGKVEFNLFNQEKLALSLEWTPTDSEIFIPNIFVLPEKETASSFKITYNTLNGGEIQAVALEGKGMRLKQKERLGAYYIFTIERTNNVDAQTQEAILKVTTITGQTHKLPLLKYDRKPNPSHIHPNNKTL